MQPFKYLGMTISKNGSCTADVHIQMMHATAAMARLNKIWDSRSVSFRTKFRLYKPLVSVLMYSCKMFFMHVPLDDQPSEAYSEYIPVSNHVLK